MLKNLKNAEWSKKLLVFIELLIIPPLVDLEYNMVIFP